MKLHYLSSILLVVLLITGCSSVQDISVDELDNYSDHQIKSVQVYEKINELQLKNDSSIIFDNDSAFFDYKSYRIIGKINDSPVSFNLTDLKFIVLEKNEISILDNSIDTVVNKTYRKISYIDPETFKKRYIEKSEQKEGKISVFTSSVSFDAAGGISNPQKGTISGLSKEEVPLEIPFENVQSVLISKLPRGMSSRFMMLKSRVNINKLSKGSFSNTSTDARLGAGAGLALATRFSDNMAAQLEILYSSVNYRYAQLFTAGDVKTDVEADMNLKYLDVAALLKYKLKKWHKNRWNLFVGSGVGINLSNSGQYDSTNYNAGFVTGILKEGSYQDLNKFDMRLILGTDYELNIKNIGLVFDLRYVLGLTTMYKTNTDGNISEDIWITNPDGSAVQLNNNSISFSVGYKIF